MRLNRLRRSARALALALLAIVSSQAIAVAQLPDWASINVTNPSSISLEQSYCAVQEGNKVHAFSCFSRRWTSITARYGAPTLFILNDCFLFQDGPVVYGYSPRTGRFAAQMTLSASAQVVQRVTPQTWLALVTDGNRIHVFQAIQGTWTTHQFTAKIVAPYVVMGTKCAFVLEDLVTVWGISAFYGTAVRLNINDAASIVGAFGNSGLAQSKGFLHGFSSYKNTWTSVAASVQTPTTHTGNAQAAFVAISSEAATMLYFSGHTGTFASHTVAGTPTLTVDRAVAVTVDGTTAYGYSALLGKVSKTSVAAEPTVTKQQFYALVDDGSSLQAFSATTGTFAKGIQAKTADITTRAEMAYHQPSSASYPTEVYSQYLNQWTATPTLSTATPPKAHILAGAVVLEEATGTLHAISMRGTKWISQATSKVDQVYLGSSRPLLEMTFVAQSGNTLYAFNERTQAWRSTTTSAPITEFQGNNTAFITLDGKNAYGFGNWSDRWSSIALTSTPVTKATAQVQSAYIHEGNFVHAFSGIGQTSTSHDYPEYWRAATQGARIQVDLAAEPEALGVLALSLREANIPLPPNGTLLIDPAVMLILSMPTLPPNGIFNLGLQVPEVPALSGLDLHLQSAVFPATQPFYLTNAIAIRIL